MIQQFFNPDPTRWEELTCRPNLDLSGLQTKVEEIFNQVQAQGRSALIKYTETFDRVRLSSFKVSDQEKQAAQKETPDALKQALQQAYANILTFHRSQRLNTDKVMTSQGVTCWREGRAIDRVGFYIPGGSAPLFSTVLMLGAPAQIAGCKEVLLCSPPNADGKIHPAILYAAEIAGIHSIYKLGGIQAIAAMALGVEDFPKVDKIFGPGNQYVTAAKGYAQTKGVAIDMPAGPSEVLVIADQTADPSFVAADLLSQAEHGPDSQVLLLTTSKPLLLDTLDALADQLAVLPRKAIAQQALQNSKAICFHNLEQCTAFSNSYAPEHLILAVEDPESLVPKISNAGSVFLGNYSCESAGDYASGTNHTLPTNGYAKAYSGVSLDSYLKKISFQKLSPEGLLKIGPAIEVMAEAEGLQAHKNAVRIRLNTIRKK